MTRPAIVAAALTALMPPRGARADGSPTWAERATQLAARVHVPARGNIGAENGTGFFIGFDDQTLYLVTAGHVIWRDPIPGSYPPSNLPEAENVALEVGLPGCAQLPASAESTLASPSSELDVAVVKIRLAALPENVRAECQGVLARLKYLPRHIADPGTDSLPRNTRAWVVGRSDLYQGMEDRPIVFRRYYGSELVFGEDTFKPEESGSAVFSENGHLIGMVIKPTTATRFSLILTILTRDWQVPTNVVGPFSNLSFSERYKGMPVSVAGLPDQPLRVPHPAPLGEVDLKLTLEDSQLVSDIVNVKGPAMKCDVTLARWLAVHKRAGVYTSIGLLVATGVALGIAKSSQSSFEQSPSRSTYDRVRLFNAITIGTGSAALAALGATGIGYLSSDRTGIACREEMR